MQFHLNGFCSGDPRIAAAADGYGLGSRSDMLPAELDVLIVGCGPTGLTLATQLAAFPEIKTRIVEQKPGPLLLGQADGIACRTMEMFEAFGFSGRVAEEAYWVNQTSFWKPDENHPERIFRADRIQDTEDGLSEFPHVILNQARVHDFYLDVMRNSPSRLEPDYSRQVMSLEIGPSASVTNGEPDGDSGYPVTVRLMRSDPGREGEEEIVRARYVVGCDGARSSVRKALGLMLHGDFANHAWGVMDVLAVTDFPDIRLKSTIRSANEGSVLIIPREGGYLVRLYVELDKLNENERISSRNVTVEQLIAAAQRILHPYQLDVKEVAWWSVYEIGQRLCEKFDDVPEADVGARSPRVFIAGDACHTHSPKAGQGMNVSMQDGFNLGWKLASVLRGRCLPRILDTYSQERHVIAKELIDFDRKFAKMFSSSTQAHGKSIEPADPAEFQHYFVAQGRFTAGTATQYPPSIISAEPLHQRLAKGFVVGMRFHSAPVIRLADAKPVHLGHAVKADGRWRLFAFADAAEPNGTSSRLRALCDFLASSSGSPLLAYTPKEADIDSVIDVRAVFQQDHRSLEVEAMPSLLTPKKGKYGLRDYEKIFCPDFDSGEDVFDLRGIDRQEGCMIIVRPDQYIANVLPLDGYSELVSFLEGFMNRA